MSNSPSTATTQPEERSLVDNLLEDLTELEQRVDELQAKDEQIEELEARVAELEERTDMLRLIEDSDSLDASQRSTALIQHAIEEVRNSDRARVTFDRDRAEEVLHYPDVDRTTIYSDMARCERLIGNDDICTYTKASQSETGATEVTFDLSGIDDGVDVSTLTNGGA